MKTTAATSDLRRDFAERLKLEGLTDYKLKSLTAWIGRLRGQRLAEGIELIEIGLNASRKGRHSVFWVIDQRFTKTALPHEACVVFLQWVVRSGVTTTALARKVAALEEAASSSTALEELIREYREDKTEAKRPSLAQAHSILAHAYRAAPPSAWPRVSAVHCGEFEPFIGAKGTVWLTIFIARSLAHLLTSSSSSSVKKDFARHLKMAEESIAAGKPTEALMTAIDTMPKDGVASLARSACAEARSTLRRPDAAGGAARPAAVKAVNLLLAAEGDDAVRGFLASLDEELRRLDVVHALATRDKTPSSPITRAIFRAGDKKGKGVVWLAELKTGDQLGLMAKQGRFWTWTEGDRDDVLATVPDVYFEQATMAAAKTALI